MFVKASANGHAHPPDMRSLTYRDGERVLPRRYFPEPTVADRLADRLCPDGHLSPGKFGTCPRCGLVP